MLHCPSAVQTLANLFSEWESHVAQQLIPTYLQGQGYTACHDPVCNLYSRAWLPALRAGFQDNCMALSQIAVGKELWEVGFYPSFLGSCF